MTMSRVTKACILTFVCSCNTSGVAGSSELRFYSGRSESSITSSPAQSLFSPSSTFGLDTTSPWCSYTSYPGINPKGQRSRLTLSLLRNIVFSCRLQGHLTVPDNDKENTWSTKSLVLATQSSEWCLFLLPPLYIYALSSTMPKTVKPVHIVKILFNFVKGISSTSISKDMF
jgi:hypothetical protein